MNALSLCSGYGGLDLAVEAVYGATIVAHAESDPKAAAVHARHWPDIVNFGDITTADWTGLDVDLVCAGFPCQPVSKAGRRKVTEDDRWLWPHIAECVRTLGCRLVVLENVATLLSPWRDGRWWRPAPVEEVVGDLATLGYDTRWCCVRASDVGAPHRRERIFLVAADTRLPRLARLGRVHPPPRESEASSHDQSPVVWGRYAPAIARWERLTRPAPWPQDEQGRLAPRFVEWMMGLPDGWVTGGSLAWTPALRILGNGVVPQQATLALSMLEAMQ